MLCVSIYLSIHLVCGHLAHGIQGVDGALRVRVHTGNIDR